ncbi:NfeD family protein [Pleomorphovibrio marinus]|uniref:NfeD family protein n=1 Tax=Pleomorphovibrio marinus TaxID=2164132 RepID=UPI000E0A9ABB|nr:NfeD family protein [Pleomorphovibrio marinus]
MTWFILTSLIIFGAILVMVEVIFIPGTTVIGGLGLVFTTIGIYYAYSTLDAVTATLFLAGALLLNFGFIVYGFKKGVWDKFSLKDTNTGRSFDDRLLGLELGQEGITRSSCRPFGKVEFGDELYEAKSDSGFIPAGTKVRIAKLEENKIIIKL